MQATLLVRRRDYIAQDLFTEIVIWRVPRSLPGSRHDLKYRLALVDAGVCVLRYDNEAGKGDHRHDGDDEQPYRFIEIAVLLDDFDADVRRYLDERDRHVDHRQPGA